MIKLAKKFFKIHRSITGEGVRKSLNLLKKEIPSLKIKKIKSGKKIFDWKVPSEWNIKNAYIKDENDKKIIDFKNNNLHVVNYSFPVNKTISKKELFNHLNYLKNKPNAIPYLTSYYKKYWGFCVSFRDFKSKFKGNNFKVFIDSNFNSKGFMNYGELIIKGRSKKEILIHTYICHPSMANNETSGPIVCTYLAKYFKKRKNYYTYRFIFTPETVGAIAYINKNLKNLIKNIIGGYVITCVGDNKHFSFLESKNKSISNRVAEKTFKELNIRYKKYSFLKRGSDERQYNAPGIDLPIGAIMRSKPGTFKEYHTSKDDFNLVTKDGLEKSFETIKKVLINFDNEIIPLSKYICEPFLTKRDLYPTLSTGKISKKIEKIIDFLMFCDGKNALDDIAHNIKIDKKKTTEIFNLLKSKKLII